MECFENKQKKLLYNTIKLWVKNLNEVLEREGEDVILRAEILSEEINKLILEYKTVENMEKLTMEKNASTDKKSGQEPTEA